MIMNLRNLWDRFLGQGDAAITVPPFDGALKPNNLLETAKTVAEPDAPEDLATDGKKLYLANGSKVMGFEKGKLTEVASVDGQITALACMPGGGFAVAVDGTRVEILDSPQKDSPRKGEKWTEANGRPMVALNALSATPDGRLLATDGSRNQPYKRWSHDLMGLGRSGRALELNPGGEAREIATDLGYAFGVCDTPEGPWVSESWRHQLTQFGAEGKSSANILDRLPGYPSRITPATGGGFWLTVFTARTMLVEFVLREKTYRKRMMKEVPPEYWVAPALSWGKTYMEPMQGAHLRTMGVIKPWAPPRSYGLILRLSPEGLVRYSLHSRVDGTNHGITAAVEVNGSLFAIAKGPGRLLEISVEETERSLLI